MNVLPNLRFSTVDPDNSLSISIAALRASSGRYRTAPQFNHTPVELLPSGNDDSSISQSFCIGGVKVLSKRYSHPSNLVQSPYKSTLIKHRTSTPPKHQKHGNSDNKNDAGGLKRDKLTKNMVRKTLTSQKKPEGKPSNNDSSAIITQGQSAIKKNKPDSMSKPYISKYHSGNCSTNITIGARTASHPANERTTKVYLSQKQSIDITVGGTGTSFIYPAAPPGSPTPETLRVYNYIPSLSDHLAKQQVSTKLKAMKQLEVEKSKARQLEKQKQNKIEAKEKELQEKKTQRRLIYVLNQVMTQAENQQFEAFKQDRGLRPKEYPSPSRSSKHKINPS